MTRSARTLVALAVAVALSLELGVVAAQVRRTPAVVREAAPAVVRDLAVAPALSGASATELGVPGAPAPAALVPAVVAPAPRAPDAQSTRVLRPRRATRPPRRVVAKAPRSCPAPPKVPATRATRARAVVGAVAVYDTPSAAKPSRSMANPRPEDNLPLEFGVTGRKGEWLRVMLPVRPNGTQGWIKVSDVELSGLPYRILIERCAHRMTVYKDGQVVMREVIAVGKPQTPTPLVRTFVDYIYPYSMKSGYGPWLISVAAFSEVLQDFAGGRGQIALHGTSATSSLGRDASHGCVRMSPEASTRLSQLVKPGTPVTIVA